MIERHRDPMELWVGTWTPEEWVEREARKAGSAGSPRSGSRWMSAPTGAPGSRSARYGLRACSSSRSSVPNRSISRAYPVKSPWRSSRCARS